MSDSQRSLHQNGTDDDSVDLNRTLLSQRVREALADAAGEDQELYHHVDPEGINRLYRHFQEMGGTFWSLEFDVEDLSVVVRADGTVSVH